MTGAKSHPTGTMTGSRSATKPSKVLYPMGSKDVKAGRGEEAVFRLFSSGYKTSRDAYIYNFSHEACAANARAMVDDYRDALAFREEHPDSPIDQVAHRYSSHVRWDRELKNNLRRRKEVVYSPANVRASQYRPFVKQYCYVDYLLVKNKGQIDRIFPSPDSENRAICVPGVGSRKPFGTLIVNTMPDLHLIEFGQCFPRYRYERRDDRQAELLNDGQGCERIDNITDTALRAFRVRYGDPTISKDTIFEYVYAILHAPGYRARFANDLAKALPRVPMASEFHPFAEAGQQLAALHLGYETCEEYPLAIEAASGGELRPEHYQVAERAMRFADDARTILVLNEHVRLVGIPAEAHRYQVNGRSPLEWLIDRYRITRDRESGIVNDPNQWFDEPRGLVAALRRAVHLSVESIRIVESLPAPFDARHDFG